MKKIYVVSHVIPVSNETTHSEEINKFELAVNDALREIRDEMNGEIIDIKLQANHSANWGVYDALIIYEKT